jgi:hypothetical protein
MEEVEGRSPELVRKQVIEQLKDLISPEETASRLLPSVSTAICCLQHGVIPVSEVTTIVQLIRRSTKTEKEALDIFAELSENCTIAVDGVNASQSIVKAR